MRGLRFRSRPSWVEPCCPWKFSWYRGRSHELSHLRSASSFQRCPPSKPAPSQFYLLCPLPPSSPTCSQLCFLFPYLSTSLVGVCLQCGRPGLGRSPGEGNGNPLQYSCLENPMDGGAWWATVHGVAKSWTRLSDFTFTLSECPPASICPLSSCTF